MKSTLILGGGFGGITVATDLRRRLGQGHRVTLVDRQTRFVMGLRKLWELVDMGSIDEGSRDRALLDRSGVRFLRRRIDGIDPESRRVATDEGVLEADYLVVALGAEARPDLVPGLSEHAHNVWRVAGVARLKAALDGLEGGRIAIVIAGVPYSCPPAPYECAMLLDDHLRQRGRRESVEISVVTLQPMLLPNAGRSGSDWLARQLTARGVGFQVGRRVERFEAGRAVFADGELTAELMIAVPPHRVPAVVAESGLTGDGQWIRVDPTTLETGFEGVFAIGDVTGIKLANGLPLPKAGVMAELEGQCVAQAIAARERGEAPPAGFDGQGFCFMETGKSTAALIQGEFFAEPEPRVELAESSVENARRKHEFEAERLERWFGGGRGRPAQIRS
jgi:sulfide:quinone oxidoreductase